MNLSYISRSIITSTLKSLENVGEQTNARLEIGQKLTRRTEILTRYFGGLSKHFYALLQGAYKAGLPVKPHINSLQYFFSNTIIQRVRSSARGDNFNITKGTYLSIAFIAMFIFSQISNKVRPNKNQRVLLSGFICLVTLCDSIRKVLLSAYRWNGHPLTPNI